MKYIIFLLTLYSVIYSPEQFATKYILSLTSPVFLTVYKHETPGNIVVEFIDSETLDNGCKSF